MGKRSVNVLATAAGLLAACEGTYENLEVFSFFLSLSLLPSDACLASDDKLGGMSGQREEGLLINDSYLVDLRDKPRAGPSCLIPTKRVAVPKSRPEAEHEASWARSLFLGYE